MEEKLNELVAMVGAWKKAKIEAYMTNDAQLDYAADAELAAVWDECCAVAEEINKAKEVGNNE